MKKDFYFGGLMSGMALCVVVMVLVSLGIGIADEPTPSPKLTINIPGRVYHIVDGDTVDVEMTIRFRVRLRDCWAPESRTRDLKQKKLGVSAKNNMTKIALGKDVIVVIPFDRAKMQRNAGRVDDAQSLSRWLGEIWVNGKSVSDLQFEGGFTGRTKKEQLELFPTIKNGIDP